MDTSQTELEGSSLPDLPRASGARILVVDDRPENLSLLERVLEPLGHEIVTATSGEEALMQVAEREFALVLLDVRMPEMDGFEAAERMRKLDRARHLPIIFVTAEGRLPGRVQRGYSVGAVDYLAKPIDHDVVRAKVQVFVDLFLLRQRADALAHRAHHDGLTGLPNRSYFLDRLEMSLRELDGRRQIAVLYLDLDGFKLVNDSLGHHAGDALLVEAAQRLRRTLRASDVVARLGGDEFAMLCAGVEDGEVAVRISERVAAAIADVFCVGGQKVSLSASVGIVLCGNDGDSADAIVRDADAAMYRAKETGSAQVVFDEGLREQAARRLELEDGLRGALDRGEFLLYYQPLVELGTGRLAGVEALLRWQHPERGLVTPAEFVPALERTGLIVPAGAWVIEEACRQLAAWDAIAPEARLRVSVNLSALQLEREGLLETVRGALAATGIESPRLCLELTESVLMRGGISIESLLSDLKELGVRLAIDDFGTGYSSLGYLKRFPVDILKIDRSFVDEIGRDPRSVSIVEAVVRLAHALGLLTVAEGIETANQLAELSALGCDLGQGYHFSPPRPAERIADLLADGLVAA